MKTTKKYWHLQFERLQGAQLLSYASVSAIADKAQQWDTCACGVQDPRIPRGSDSIDAPDDSLLYELGRQFNAVLDIHTEMMNDAMSVHSTYDEIQILHSLDGISNEEKLMNQNLVGYIMEDIMEFIEIRAEQILEEMEEDHEK